MRYLFLILFTVSLNAQILPSQQATHYKKIQRHQDQELLIIAERRVMKGRLSPIVIRLTFQAT